jgi:hypothetical protein
MKSEDWFILWFIFLVIALFGMSVYVLWLELHGYPGYP